MNQKVENSCLIIAGEKSGEDHAMSFFHELQEQTPNCSYYGVGGTRLEKEGVELLYHLKDFSGIGISEVLSKIPFYFKALDHIVSEVKKRNTKTAILIDFQGFNLKLAKKLKKMGVNVLYYVAPQAWVWKPWRAKVLEKNVHTLFTILPFEKKWFSDRGVSKVKGVIHPLKIEFEKELQHIRARSHSDFQNRKPRILLLPGSRNIEVDRLLPTFIKGLSLITEDGIDFEVGIVKSESVRSEIYDKSSMAFDNVWDSEELLQAIDWADISVAASGTVTLATGLFALPTIVCYEVSLFTEFIASILLPYDGPISLTNIIHDNEYIYPEHMQHKASRYNVYQSLKKWLNNSENYNYVTNKLLTTKDKLSGDDFSVPMYMADVINNRK